MSTGFDAWVDTAAAVLLLVAAVPDGEEACASAAAAVSICFCSILLLRFGLPSVCPTVVWPPGVSGTWAPVATAGVAAEAGSEALVAWAWVLVRFVPLVDIIMLVIRINKLSTKFEEKTMYTLTNGQERVNVGTLATL